MKTLLKLRHLLAEVRVSLCRLNEIPVQRALGAPALALPMTERGTAPSGRHA